MLKSLEIHNFQSHKDTRILFHPGFNSIVGSTDSGKSAIYRSIYWLRFNKAVNFVSFWNRKKDGNPIDPSSVSIVTQDHSIIRERSSELNGYKIDDKDPLEAVGRGEPPEQVTRLLNISDINFFSQHNPPFLLTKSAGEVATILNDLIHLSDIDRVLSNADRLKRSNKRELEQNSMTLAALTDDLSKLSWVESAKDELEHAESINKELNVIYEKERSLLPVYEQYRKIIESSDELNRICDIANPLIKRIDEIDKELEEVMLRYSELERVVSSIKKMESSIESLKKLDVSEEIAEYDNIQNELDEITDSIADFTNWISMYSGKMQIVKRTETELDIVKKELEAIPVCSECGRPLEECDDSNC